MKDEDYEGLQDLDPKPFGVKCNGQKKAVAVVRYLNILDDPEFFKNFRIGSTRHKRYSPRAVDRILQTLPKLDIKKVWEEFGPRPRKTRS